MRLMCIVLSGVRIAVKDGESTQGVVMGWAGNNSIVRNTSIVDTGAYGLSAQLEHNGIALHHTVSGIQDAAMNIGM